MNRASSNSFYMPRPDNFEMAADDISKPNLDNKVDVSRRPTKLHGYKDENERLFYENKRLRIENEENLQILEVRLTE